MYKVALRLAVLCLLTGLCFSSLRLDRALAQENSDTVDSRLDRLEHDLNELQRQVYRNNVTGAASQQGGDATSGVQSGNQALSLQLRMDQIESEMRDLTGQVEEVQYGISQLKSRMDKMQSDDEQRFEALEHPGSAPPVVSSSGTPVTSAGGAPAAQAAGAPTPLGGDQGGAGDQSDANAAPSTNGFLTAPGSGGTSQPVAPNQGPAPGDQTAAVPAAPAPSSAVTLPPGTPEQQYSYAFGLLRQAKYGDAKQALETFLKKHPRDPLAGNAQYWLGETYFAQNQFQQAAAVFAQGYAKYPQSPKASDNLLKLGISLGNIGRKRDACLAFAKLDSEYTKVLPAVKDREREEKQKFGCS